MTIRFRHILKAMQLGSHFGKRKPRWNFFNDRQRAFNQKYGMTIRLAFVSLSVQALIFLPVIYWSIQNYNFFEDNVPAAYNLKTYLSAEKSWIIFLYFVSLIFTGLVNFGLFTKALRHTIHVNDHEILPDGSDDQRHVS